MSRVAVARGGRVAGLVAAVILLAGCGSASTPASSTKVAATDGGDQTTTASPSLAADEGSQLQNISDATSISAVVTRTITPPARAGRLNCAHPAVLQTAVLETAGLSAMARNTVTADQRGHADASVASQLTSLIHDLGTLQRELIHGNSGAVAAVQRSVRELVVAAGPLPVNEHTFSFDGVIRVQDNRLPRRERVDCPRRSP